MRFISLVALLLILLAGTYGDLGFKDPNTDYVYRVRSSDNSIQVSRLKSGQTGPADRIQTISFRSQLVDFDLHCSPVHCYLVALTAGPNQNVKLYSWRRVQFDLIAKRDSFARPAGVTLFTIQSGFYIAVAQEQLHLAPAKLRDYEESRFVGSVVLKFFKDQEQNIRYHQFIRLPFNPNHVAHFTSILNGQSSNNTTGLLLQQNPNIRPIENHFLIFSLSPEWNQPNSAPHLAYIWSPLNDHFWPYRMPRGASIDPNPLVYPNRVLTFPPTPPINNFTRLEPIERVEPVESCLYQLQRLLNDREMHARELIESSRSLWRSPLASPQASQRGPINVTAQVIIHGNVIVRGSLIESPQITLFGDQLPIRTDVVHLARLADSHSPAIVENKLKKSLYKLQYIRDKLSKAVPIAINPGTQLQFNSHVRFFGPIRSRRIIFTGNGIANSNVRINGIPFRQLEHELVSLRGAQEVSAKVVFTGNVVADFLEIHGIVNDLYYIKDALDISSNQIQTVELIPSIPNRSATNTFIALEFISVSAPDVVLAHNTTLNDIILSDFIVRDGPAQVVVGRKTFKRIAINHLELGKPRVPLNGFDIGRIIDKSINIYDQNHINTHKILTGNHNTFSKPIVAKKLTIHGLINKHINVSMLIHDSIKVMDSTPQIITGHKRFLDGLKVAHLTTEGAINGVTISQVFNLNPLPPTYDYNRYLNSSMSYVPVPPPITGKFTFLSPVTIAGNLNAELVNDIDLARHAIRRVPPLSVNNNKTLATPPQIVRGKKIFHRPLRVTGSVRLMDNQEISRIMGPNYTYPTINGIDIRTINYGIERQMQNPNPIFIDNLEIEGNLDLDTSFNRSGVPITSFGNQTACPLDVIRHRLVLGGGENQLIQGPVRINTLRAKTVSLDPYGLNGLTIPNDFVLKSVADHDPRPVVEELPVFGHKSFDHIVVGRPQSAPMSVFDKPSNGSEIYNNFNRHPSIIIGPRFSINSVPINELQTFMVQERQRNSTGEIVLQTLSVFGNIIAKTINGNSWPDGILLKSIMSNPDPLPSPYFHRRIYSPMVFVDSSDLIVENQLVLRGPVQLHGRLNGVNLTEFGRSSVTYGDKDLLSTAKTIRNKNFAGGLTVLTETLSQGLIEGINIDEMKNRVVTINGYGQSDTRVFSPKIFMSDVNFNGPLTIAYLNNLPLYQFLKRIKEQRDNDHIHIFGKKTVTGVLKIYKNLFVEGLLNGINFLDLKARAISLSPSEKELQFNRTLTIDGDVYMDNLLVDEKSGVLDGVKMTSLVPINQVNHNSYPPPQPIMRTTPPYAMPVTYAPSLPPPRRPLSINYERPDPIKYQIGVSPLSFNNPMIEKQISSLRKQIVSTSLIKHSPLNDLVIGFIESPSNDIGHLRLADVDIHDSIHDMALSSFIQLDQVDFPFRPTTYHLSVGISNDRMGKNTTQVFSSVGGSNVHQLFVLPVAAPKSAMFLKTYPQQALFLLISENPSHNVELNSRLKCPRYNFDPLQPTSLDPKYYDANPYATLDGVHVYLFHSLQNSSSLANAYFDLYQMINLPGIDGFEKFNYQGSNYVVASSRSTGRVNLLLLRGYSGFEMVSYFDVPSLETIEIMYNHDEKPFILVKQKDGLHKLMEPVII